MTGVSFWVLKTFTTTLGDLCGDAMSLVLHLGYRFSLVIVLIVATVLLAAQLRSRRWNPWLYWALMLASSAVGAEISDGISRSLHWGSATTSGVLLFGLLATLVAWKRGQGLPLTSAVSTGRDELQYWMAAILANSLGSALGDMLGDRLGFLGATSVFVFLLALLYGVHKTTRVAPRTLFWAAFTISRVPF